MTNRKKNIAVITSFIFIAVMLVIFALLIIVRDAKKSKEIVPEVTTGASTESEAVDNYIPVKRKKLSVETRIANTVIRVSVFRSYIPSEDDTENVESESDCEGISCHIVDVTDPDFVPKEGYNYIPSEIAEPAECEEVEVVYYEIPAEY